jgi:hypothetical protein
VPAREARLEDDEAHLRQRGAILDHAAHELVLVRVGIRAEPHRVGGARRLLGGRDVIGVGLSLRGGGQARDRG